MNIFNSDETMLSSFFLDGMSERLLEFVWALWESTAQYKVLMARRMFNLNYALMKICKADENKEYSTGNIMSNTAFLLSAKEIAEYYYNRKKFPEIIICDDILIHGRGIMKLLEKFEELVYGYLLEYELEIPRGKVREDFTRAVTIYVFAQNTEKVLIDTRFRIYSKQMLPFNVLLELSQQISWYLLNCGVANTSYVISVEMPPYLLQRLYKKNSVLPSMAFRYRGRKQLLFCRQKSNNTLETIRINYPANELRYKGILTSLTLFADIQIDTFNVLCRDLAGYLEREKSFIRITEYLKREEENLVKPRAQLVSFLFSVASICDFCKEQLDLEKLDLYKMLVTSDFDKIITNFDCGKDFRHEVTRLFRDFSIDSETGKIFWSYLRSIPGTVTNCEERPGFTKFSLVARENDQLQSECYEFAEDIFYEIGIDAEYDANTYLATGKPFNPKKPGYDMITLLQYLQIMGRRSKRELTNIGCLLGMMDSGLLSMNLERTSKRDYSICNVLKAGEMSTYVLPRRFSVFIPALAYVEREYRRKGTYLRNILGGFIDYIQGHCYEQNGHIIEKDADLLESLERKKSLLLYMYSAGHNFKDWNIRLRTAGDYRTGYDSDSEQMTFEEEWLRKNHYLYYAKEYLRS